ncbi:VOC family protein [Chitinophaga vietnamensis]|uniref:VOC family protein n=1 Tax=Chitinophaga vietnamensis TaxID=2593957 RepID=UPI00117831B3|nr:VOC family protein [Chitinophaga vietnamensis]
MIRTEPIIGVKNVALSAAWYVALLDCVPQHGGNVFEILADKDGTVILCLHHWGDHDHPTLSDPRITAGNGLILYIRVDDLGACWKNALRLKANVEAAPHLNENSGLQEFALRDPDGYYLIITTF